MKYMNFLKKTAVALIIVAVAFAGCEETPEDNPGITIDNVVLTQTVFADDTSVAGGVTFTTAGAWAAAVAEGIAKAGEPAWLAIDPSSGDAAGEYTVNITLETNTTGEDRTATITVTSGEMSIKIGVTQKATKEDGTAPVTGITLSETALTLPVGQTDTLDVTVAPDNAGNKSVEWTSSNEKVATVSNTGVVTAVAEGTVGITATAKEGGFKAECTVTVTEPARTMTMTTVISPRPFFINDRRDIGLAGTGTAVIDWGDGTAPDTVNLSDATTYPSHNFSDTTKYTIVIEGQNVTFLNCAYMQLTTLDVSKNTALETLECRGSSDDYLTNRLTTLDVSKNTALKELDCSHNPITSLDVSRNTGLTHLVCDSIPITALDVSKNTALRGLSCYSNRLTNLDVSKNTALSNLDCAGNEFAAAGLDALFGTLHANAGSKTIYIWGNPGADGCNRSIAMDKGWTVIAQ